MSNRTARITNIHTGTNLSSASPSGSTASPWRPVIAIVIGVLFFLIVLGLLIWAVRYQKANMETFVQLESPSGSCSSYSSLGSGASLRSDAQYGSLRDPYGSMVYGNTGYSSVSGNSMLF